MEIPIYPNLKKSIKIVKCKYNVFNYIPFTSAKISTQLFDDNDIAIETRVYEINQDNGFMQWGTDDTFLTKWVQAKLQESNN